MKGTIGLNAPLMMQSMHTLLLWTLHLENFPRYNLEGLNLQFVGANVNGVKLSTGARGKKRKNDSIVKGAIRLEELVIRMPHALRKQLVDDCESVTHLGKLVKLPRTPNVDDILKKYLEYRSNSDEYLQQEPIIKIFQLF